MQQSPDTFGLVLSVLNTRTVRWLAVCKNTNNKLTLFAAALPVLGPVMKKLGFSINPKKEMNFVVNTIKTIMEQRRHDSQVIFSVLVILFSFFLLLFLFSFLSTSQHPSPPFLLLLFSLLFSVYFSPSSFSSLFFLFSFLSTSLPPAPFLLFLFLFSFLSTSAPPPPHSSFSSSPSSPLLFLFAFYILVFFFSFFFNSRSTPVT